MEVAALSGQRPRWYQILHRPTATFLALRARDPRCWAPAAVVAAAFLQAAGERTAPEKLPPEFGRLFALLGVGYGSLLGANIAGLSCAIVARLLGGPGGFAAQRAALGLATVPGLLGLLVEGVAAAGFPGARFLWIPLALWQIALMLHFTRLAQGFSWLRAMATQVLGSLLVLAVGIGLLLAVAP